MNDSSMLALEERPDDDEPIYRRHVGGVDLFGVNRMVGAILEKPPVSGKGGSFGKCIKVWPMEAAPAEYRAMATLESDNWVVLVPSEFVDSGFSWVDEGWWHMEEHKLDSGDMLYIGARIQTSVR